MSSNSFLTPMNSTTTTNITTTSEPGDVYDHNGAAIYIAAVLIWYSTGLVLMLFFHVRPRKVQSQFIFDYETTNQSTPSTVNPFANYHNIQADHTKRQILNELKDPERRQRLWKIYFSSKEKQNEPHPQYYQTITADTVTIGRINRKLATIHRMDTRGDDENFIPSLNIPSNESTKFFSKRFIPIRRSSGAGINPQRPLYRVQSQPDTATASSITEAEPFIEKSQSNVTSMNGSRKRNNKFLNRFTVEKVPESNRNCSTKKENVSK
jgi:hypothetical protein